MSQFAVFKSTIPSINYIFGNGKPAIFVQGRFCTDIPAEISELEYEVKLGHPHIFIDPNDAVADSAVLDPIAGLREKIIAEYLAAAEKANDPANDMGSTVQEPLKPTNSQDIATAAAGGSGTGLAARLLNISAKK
jgi:hypothetical protein